MIKFSFSKAGLHFIFSQAGRLGLKSPRSCRYGLKFPKADLGVLVEPGA